MSSGVCPCNSVNVYSDPVPVGICIDEKKQMTLLAFITHLIFALLLAVISGFITWWMLNRVKIMDVPNERSSHEVPVPRGGGLAIVGTFFLGILAIYFLGDKAPLTDQHYYWGFLGSSILVAGISFYDDISGKSFQVKLATQLIAVFCVMGFGIFIDQLSIPPFGWVNLGWVGLLITIIWIVGLTNAYNFMDGIDGLAAGTAVVASAFFAYITFNEGSLFIYIASYTVLAGSLGFLVFNRPPARIFMGDVGSAFLGFVFAVMAIIAARYDHSHTSFLVMPLLLFHFIYDTAFTFSRRALAGERVTEAHRTHLYQLLVQMGMTHKSVTGVYCLLGILQGLAAISMLEIASEARLWVFFPFLLLYSLLAYEIITRAKRLGII